jgi:hypothetical protein
VWRKLSLETAGDEITAVANAQRTHAERDLQLVGVEVKAEWTWASATIRDLAAIHAAKKRRDHRGAKDWKGVPAFPRAARRGRTRCAVRPVGPVV